MELELWKVVDATRNSQKKKKMIQSMLSSIIVVDPLRWQIAIDGSHN